MDIILYFFRDKIVGLHYLMYAFVCLFLMFSIIGYLFKQKYGKLEIILNTSQASVEKKEDVEIEKQKKKEKKKKGKAKEQIVQTTNQQELIVNPNIVSQQNSLNQTVVNQSIGVSISNQEEIQEVITPEIREKEMQTIVQQTSTIVPQKQVLESNQPVVDKIPEIQ